MTLALWMGLFTNVFVVYFLNGWLPIPVKDEGFTIADAALISAILGVAIGAKAVAALQARRQP